MQNIFAGFAGLTDQQQTHGLIFQRFVGVRLFVAEMRVNMGTSILGKARSTFEPPHRNTSHRALLREMFAF